MMSYDDQVAAGGVQQLHATITTTIIIMVAAP